MKTSQDGIDLIKSFEGFAPMGYICPAGKLTIGYGHVIRKGETFGTLTEPEATALLAVDLVKYEAAVLGCVDPDVALEQHQFDALVSFCYNVGPANVKTSTLLKKLNNGDYEGAANEFQKWVRGGGKVLPGLVKRRIAERAMFLGKYHV